MMMTPYRYSMIDRDHSPESGDYFVYMDGRRPGAALPIVGANIAAFFAAHNAVDPFDFRIVFLESANRPDPMRVMLNVACKAHIRPCQGQLLVSQKALDALRSVAVVETIPVIVEVPYNYPFSVGDHSYRESKCFDPLADYSEEIAQEFAAAYPASRDVGLEMHEVVMSSACEVRERYDDWRDYDVMNGFSEADRIRVSHRHLASYGVVWEGGFVLSSRAWETMGQFVTWPFFWTERFPIGSVNQ